MKAENFLAARRANWHVVWAMMLPWGAPAAAVSDADKCESDKLKRAGQYAVCRLKAEGKAIKKGDLPDYTKCDQKLADKFASAEGKFGVACPTSGDAGDVEAQVAADADFIALKLGGVRFVDNGDGTVTDSETGLMWEKKVLSGGIHDASAVHTWSASGTAPDGTVFTVFLATLNKDASADGSTTGGCFAGYCDWRLPTVLELRTLRPDSCSEAPCFDPIFNAFFGDRHWTATAVTGDATSAFYVNNGVGLAVDAKFKTDSYYVFAVRTGL